MIDDIGRELGTRYGVVVRIECGYQIIQIGPRLSAVSVPRSIAERVTRAVDPSVPMPVLANPRGQRWIFLVEPIGVLRDRVAGPLAAHDVIVLPYGHRIVLPMSDSASSWRWIRLPDTDDFALPTRPFVLGQIRKRLSPDPPNADQRQPRDASDGSARPR